ncbi:hypothetical protein APHAL10511_001051 [Amanita phalloides]|nr:hypothetical protein APHAL10511_001051 [Amanita phalloides]
MPPKRRRQASPAEKIKRSAPSDSKTSLWGWVGTEAKDVSGITAEHILATCGFTARNSYSLCPNRFVQGPAGDKLDNDIIVISDDEISQCSKKVCKPNPNCLNYLGQEKWEKDLKACALFAKTLDLGEDPTEQSRESDQPVGLKNLGATCYANASLQVWFRDLAFRAGVYGLQPSEGSEATFTDSPIFHLQVTFAAMQEGRQKVFNPTKLVESLALRTAEQQDAQEFAKLFMSHLDAEFQRQPVLSLRSLVTDQFQGKQVHTTVCDSCQRPSEREAGFLELEINLAGNVRLTDGIANLLQSEKLDDENKYYCSHCDALQDATRYTKLRTMPPVLHFSLMRFVYDVSTMERRKSKNIISFPATINMGDYLDKGEGSMNSAMNYIYDLRGVLLHKGPSAYHGHYEAQVYDQSSQCWYQFNDECVTKIKTLGDRTLLKKKKDSDPEEGASTEQNDSSIRSKDAYMLIYARRASRSRVETESELTIPSPPSRASDAVESLNRAHSQACDEFTQKKQSFLSHFEQVRTNLKLIYHSWNLSRHDEKSVIISQQALINWLSDHCVRLACQKDNPWSAKQDEDRLSVDAGPPNGKVSIRNDEIQCIHGCLDPEKATEMKRITESAYAKIVNLTQCTFIPIFRTDQVCRVCVENHFKERLYQLEHPQHVIEFDRAIALRDDSTRYWISKKWLRDWRSTKPRMHVASEGDPGPESGDFQHHVRCEHAGLSVNVMNRCQISMQGVILLRRLFPRWDPPSEGEEPCVVCTAQLNASREDRREVKKRAEEEKARLFGIYDSTFDGDSCIQSGPCAVISANFVKSWKQWLTFPMDSPRPEMIDNSIFFCEHDMLLFDPNSALDLDSTMLIIHRHDWETLESYYTGGPLISLAKTIREDGSSHYDQEVPTCIECRLKKKIDWTTTEIVIQFFDPNQKSGMRGKARDASRKTFRQSRRLRQMKQHGERRRITISKDMTVKEIKIKIQDEWNIATICQQLFHYGTELQDNAVTVAALEITANDVLELREVTEVHDLDSDTEGPSGSKDEGQGFTGTVLSGGLARTTSPPTGSKVCPSCTLHNPLHVPSFIVYRPYDPEEA